MRSILMCGILAVAAFSVNTVWVDAHEPHRHHHPYYRGPVVVVRPAPIVIGAPSLSVARPPIIVDPWYAPPIVAVQPAPFVPVAPAPLVVTPRPIISLGIGIRIR